PVDQDKPDDLTEGKRDDGEIVAAQAQHRKAEQNAPERCKESADRQAKPEGQAETLREQCVGIGTDRVECDIAKVEQAGEANHDIQTPAEHDVSEDLNAQIEQVTVIVKYDWRHGREDEQCGTEELRDMSCEAADGFRHIARPV